MRVLSNAFVRLCAIGLLTLGVFNLLAATEPPQLVTLPKFEVRDSRPAYLVTIPGYEILSFIAPKETADFANKLQEQSWFISQLLPPGRRSRPPVPVTIILESRFGAELKSRRIADQHYDNAHRHLVERTRAWQPDEDTYTVFSEYPSLGEKIARALPGGVSVPASRVTEAELYANFLWLSERLILRVPRWYRDELAASLAFLRKITLAEAILEVSAQTSAMPPQREFSLGSRASILGCFSPETRSELS